MENTINAAIQIIPKTTLKDYYPLIDAAIDVIKDSGLKYIVTPMETVIEGEYGKVLALLERAQRASIEAGAEELIVNIKLHIRNGSDITFEEKTAKHQQG
ncbi:thiamine-binding protein [Fulvivirga sp. M361]|uniref:thiamine-binding protein n=1 Tax=Fulvivirga sp. M361 TaxID=2594266 RepID=UPI00117BAD1F|nr:thiamine-binding protein [Fulvivirga sp. M361]TRX49205.1 thiamine-binding protein [Fulvivirga sp. M361]